MKLSAAEYEIMECVWALGLSLIHIYAQRWAFFIGKGPGRGRRCGKKFIVDVKLHQVARTKARVRRAFFAVDLDAFVAERFVCLLYTSRGVAGIPPVRGPYVRPLLWAQRADVLAYLARCGVPHVTDATNDTDAYLSLIHI